MRRPRTHARTGVTRSRFSRLNFIAKRRPSLSMILRKQSNIWTIGERLYGLVERLQLRRTSPRWRIEDRSVGYFFLAPTM